MPRARRGLIVDEREDRGDLDVMSERDLHGQAEQPHALQVAAHPRDALRVLRARHEDTSALPLMAC